MQEANTKPIPLRLDDRYTWDELAELFSDRIEKTGFIDVKEWNRERFKLWFKDRKKIGLRFDWRLVARAYIIWKSLQIHHDHFTVIVGGEGLGKSTLETQFCSWIAPNMDLKDIVFDMPQYIKKLKHCARDYKMNKKNKNDRSIGIDEGGISLFSRESMSLSNRSLAKTFMIQRFLNIHVAICIPYYWNLDAMIRNHRINTLIIIRKRGEYKAIVGKGIKIMNRIGGKDKDKDLWAIPIPYQYFWEGSFRKGFPKNISELKYNNYKFKNIKDFLDDTELESQAVKMIKIKRLEEEFGITRDVLVSEIQKGNIEGRKIGNNWFVTKKSYDKLIMAK